MMRSFLVLLILFIAAHPTYSADSAAPVLITGATGRTGALLYNKLKAAGVPVRGLVRNATKAKERLNCSACDASDGIFVGDVTKPATLEAPMAGAGKLVILTSSVPLKAPNGSYYFPPGATPKEVDFDGAKNQMFAAIKAGVERCLLVSTMGTTDPAGMDFGSGHISFYKLNGEADLMSLMPFTIVKPGGLLDEEGGKSLLVPGHDDELQKEGLYLIPRADVAEVLKQAIQMETLSLNLRFDLVYNPSLPATGDFVDFFTKARRWGNMAMRQ